MTARRGGTLRLAGMALAVPLLLTACAPPASTSHGYISDKAMAALPPGTDLSTVHRRDNGCYFIQTRDELSGYLTDLRGPDGKIVCDDI
ncbi:MAG: hypothetical protein WCD16_04925 [Paracoccaceae bacterium]